MVPLEALAAAEEHRTSALRALYSIKETEIILSISHATVYRLIKAGKLDARKIGGKTVITAHSIHELLGALPKAPGAR